MTDFAENLRRARIAKEFSKSQMAKALQLSLTAYSLYEKGEREPPLRKAQKIAELLDVTIDELLAPNLEKELHIYLDCGYLLNDSSCEDFCSTDTATRERQTVIHTTQTHFCSWKYANMGYRLFVHKGGRMIELKIGKNPSTDRLLKGTENLERLLLGGEFDFEKGDLNKEREDRIYAY